jgi:hypothetical protein
MNFIDLNTEINKGRNREIKERNKYDVELEFTE